MTNDSTGSGGVNAALRTESQFADHFALFDLPQRFEVDTAALEQAFHAIQQRVHPDRFARAADAEKRVAMQWAAQANDAYRTLKSPLERAIYMLRLRGIDVRSEQDTSIAPGFLMQQMEWREAIEDASAARNVSALETVLDELREAGRVRFDKLAAWLDSGADQPAAETARELLFIARVESEVDRQLSRLE
ncbi:Fe-S protein assembly co-chaperone HscB [Chitinasiproducens palmae]|uniref:Co-chaperone protein HscB homolog n=1 Tax=Chitinasiproducens palmae TaxID=1770053 RepID=A0A1H2PQY2_9BURK|nr:Fe-S protein assembly co-chaperone HscB [Chitinasiproducens palmae]SDV49269.1 Co-chaperone protein HscB [Chitinasiproducens palmae]